MYNLWLVETELEIQQAKPWKMYCSFIIVVNIVLCVWVIFEFCFVSIQSSECCISNDKAMASSLPLDLQMNVCNAKDEAKCSISNIELTVSFYSYSKKT